MSFIICIIATLLPAYVVWFLFPKTKIWQKLTNAMDFVQAKILTFTLAFFLSMVVFIMLSPLLKL